MIRQSAIDEFLTRPRRNYHAYRDFSLQRLENRMRRLPVRPPIWKRLRKEQRVGFIAGVETRKFVYWYDMGMGKTMLAISLARYFRKAGEIKRVLVLIPNKVNKYEWANQIEKHSPLSSYEVLAGSSADKWQQLQDSKSLFVLETYGGLVRMCCTPVRIKEKGITKLKPDKGLVRELLRNVQGVVLDESIMITRKKGHGSLMHRICRYLGKHCRIAYALNGTPFGRDPTDMFGQMHVIDQGETLGSSLGLFRAAFFKAKKNYWGGFKYIFDKRKNKLLHEIIRNRSIRYEAEEGTLPPVTDIVKKIPLPVDAEDYYEDAKQAIIAARGNYNELKNAFHRMRKISSGWIGYDDDETGQRAEFEFKPNPKMEMLLSLIEEVRHAHRIVVFHDYIYSGNMIERELKKLKIGYARLYGKTKDPDVQLKRFNADPKCRVFILQNASGGFGLDRLKIAKYGIYYECPVPTVTRVQTRRRIERQGSTHDRVFLIDLVVPGTYDEQLLAAHREGIDLFELIVEGRRKGKGKENNHQSRISPFFPL